MCLTLMLVQAIGVRERHTVKDGRHVNSLAVLNLRSEISLSPVGGYVRLPLRICEKLSIYPSSVTMRHIFSLTETREVLMRVWLNIDRESLRPGLRKRPNNSFYVAAFIHWITVTQA